MPDVLPLPRVVNLVEEFDSFKLTQAQLIEALEYALLQAKAHGGCSLQLGDLHTIEIESGVDAHLIVDYQIDVI